MLTFLTRWMQDFQSDGIRMDSVENVANWDFIQKFKDEARAQFRNRYSAAGDGADAKFLVVGEELTMPLDLLSATSAGRPVERKISNLCACRHLGRERPTN